jgi:hypothetical protein
MFGLSKIFRRPINTASVPAQPKPAPFPEGKPANYGECWNRKEANLDWYTWMYNGRIEQHHALQTWFRYADRLRRIDSVLEFGCGMAVGYAEFLADRIYTGVDIAPHLIEWCKSSRKRSGHNYLACDFVREPFGVQYDLVFSQGTIDNNYDMDEFLLAAVRASRCWVYITAYRGYFVDLTEHRREWREADGCFYNDLSPVRATAVLQAAGCRDVFVFPSFTGRKEIPYETVIIAKVPDTSG